MKFEKTMTCSPVSNGEPWVEYDTIGQWEYFYHDCDNQVPRPPTYVNSGDWSRYIGPVVGYSAKYGHK